MSERIQKLMGTLPSCEIAHNVERDHIGGYETEDVQGFAQLQEYFELEKFLQSDDSIIYKFAIEI